MEVWLQRISIGFSNKPQYNEPLCKLVAGEKLEIWNNDWISSAKLKNLVKSDQIINRTEIKNLEPVISRIEMALFIYMY